MGTPYQKKILFTPAATVLLLLLMNFNGIAQQLDNLKTQKPFKIGGSVATNFIFYNASGISERMKPFSYVLSANATVSVYGFSMPFSFTYSDRQRNYSQPFNQFGMSPTYKWAKFHLGYRNINFSDFTLAGHTFLGAGVELNPGKFRFGFVYGRFKRSTPAFPQAIDTMPDFTRKGIALKIGVGSSKNFADLILLKIADDSASVSNPLQYPSRTPAQNFVTGLNTRLTFSKKLTFDAEIAGSLLTSDLKAAGISGLENIGILNKTSRFFTVNQSTSFTTAIRTTLAYKVKLFSTRLEYRRIDPGYTSMGAYFFNNDIENLTLAPSVSLLKRKLLLRGSLGLQRDNLRKTKKATSLRTISSMGISFNPSSIFGVDANYSNYSNNQRAGRIPLVDSLKQYTTNRTINIAPRLVFAHATASHMIVLMFNQMGLTDKNPLSPGMAETDATLLNLNYALNLNKLMVSITAGLNHTTLSSFAGQNKANGVSAGISRSLKDGRFIAGFSNSLQWAEVQKIRGTIYNASVNSSFRLKKHHTFRFSAYYTKSTYPDGFISPSFNELKGDLSYVFTF